MYAELHLLQELIDSFCHHYSSIVQNDDDIKHIHFSWLSLLIVTILSNHNTEKHHIILFSSQAQAEQMYLEVEFFLQNIEDLKICKYQPMLLPVSRLINSERHHSNKHHVIRTLYNIVHTTHTCLFTSIDAIVQKLPGKDIYLEQAYTLFTGQKQTLKDIHNYVIQHNYQRMDIVEQIYDYSIKGSIIDIFCPTYEMPLRIDVYDGIVDSIRFFNIKEQISHEKVDKVVLLSQLLYPEDTVLVDLFSYYGKKPYMITWDRDVVQNRYSDFLDEQQLLFSQFQDLVKDPNKFFLREEEILPILELSRNITYRSTNTNSISFQTKLVKKYKGVVSQFLEDLDKEYKDFNVFISTNSTEQHKRLMTLIKSYFAKKPTSIHMVQTPIHEGCIWGNNLILTSYDILGKTNKELNFTKYKTTMITDLLHLEVEDYVVHIDYGIGRFLGFKRITIRNIEKDFITIEYADNKLFIPIEKLSLIHRYIGSSTHPRLDFLGKRSTWKHTKEQAQKDVEKLAQELLHLYACREKSQGIIYPKDSVFQEEFEASFEYEETPDQLQAIKDVKHDMESSKPMDRLLCGDVGFGKTEVAIRSAFKSAMAGRQVALLCPTTILCLQHYKNFSVRYHNYPISIASLSRFSSNVEKKDIIEKLKLGKIDIVIGTHSLLSEKISFASLGLLIIDEEQKFGVQHKETIKKMKENIDTLTMTATPIPRTLHFSLSSLRDISLITTPPLNRLKVETYVLSDDDAVLRMAVLRELERKGQVYIIYNQVETIQIQYKKIQNLFPNEKIAVLHGQMKEHDIENIMLNMYQGTYSILLSTNIIESGIDIPNVNTLIVLNAHRFGLSQLYQLKGRVGRSNRQAWSYFFYSPKQVLTDSAQRRLNTLEEYDDLGSGFAVAMKDLEIRGAGNLLGKEQSGNIMVVGLEVYMTMLREKIAKLRHKENTYNTQETNVMIMQDFYIPDTYINDARQKMEFYKKILSARDINTIDTIKNHMTDRFGQLPDVMINILSYQKIFIMGNLLGLAEIKWDGNDFMIMASAKSQYSIEVLNTLIREKKLLVKPKNPQMVYINIYQTTKRDILQYAYEMLVLLALNKPISTENALHAGI